MPSLAEWKLIGITLIATFYISAIVYGIMCEFVIRLKNKTKKCKRQQITHKHAKIELCRHLCANMQQEFIGQNKMIFSQLVKM